MGHRAVLEHFAYASDGKYALQLKIAVASLLYAIRTNDLNVHIHILDLGLNGSQWAELSKTWSAIRNTAKLHRHIIPTDQFSRYKRWNNSYAPYARLNLPKILNDVEWCLYADCDTLFIDDPVLLQNSLSADKALVGHLNPTDVTNAYDKKWFDDKSIELDFNKYVCSGLVAINLDWFRKNNAQQMCFDFLDKYPNVLTPDQSALNFVCRDRIALFPDGWGDFAYEAIKGDCCHCLHYAGSTPWNPPKSWMFYCGEHKLLEIWYAFADKIVHEPNLKSRFMPKQKFLIIKIIAAMLWPLLRIVAFLRLYPKSFSDHALAIRQRCDSDIISTMMKMFEMKS